MTALIRSSITRGIAQPIVRGFALWTAWRLRRRRINAIADLPAYLRRDIGWREDDRIRLTERIRYRK